MSEPAVDAYMAAQPEPQRAMLAHVRAVVRELLPEAEEVISYGMPAYRLGRSRPFLTLAGHRRHCSLYPATQALKSTLGDELAPFLTAKATIRFSVERPLPDALLRRIVKGLAAERGG
jgi:uncharacterized protein YdhG (YjbR/CyaY superfamily)